MENENKKAIFTFKSASIHLAILALIVLIAIFPFELVSKENNLLVIIIESIIVGLCSLFLLIELIFLLVTEIKLRKDPNTRFIRHFTKDNDFREIIFTPFGTIFSTLFALTHFVVFFITGLWYFGALCVFYLLGIGLKVYFIHVDDEEDEKYYRLGVIIANVSSIILSMLFVLTIFFTIHFENILHEPNFLFILDIIFFVLKFIISTLALISTLKEKNHFLLSHVLVSFSLTFYTGYGIIVTILHHNGVLTTPNILLVGLIISITLLVISILFAINSLRRIKK